MRQRIRWGQLRWAQWGQIGLTFSDERPTLELAIRARVEKPDGQLQEHVARSEGTSQLDPWKRRVHHLLGAVEVRNLVGACVHGDSVRQLATRFRVHRSTVVNHLERADVARRPDVAKLWPTDIAEAAELCAEARLPSSATRSQSTRRGPRCTASRRSSAAPDVLEAFSAVYRRVLPDMPVFHRMMPSLGGYSAFLATAADGIRKVGAFGDPTQWRFDWERPYTRDEWLDEGPLLAPTASSPRRSWTSSGGQRGRDRRRGGQLCDAVRRRGGHRGANRCRLIRLHEPSAAGGDGSPDQDAGQTPSHHRTSRRYDSVATPSELSIRRFRRGALAPISRALRPLRMTMLSAR